MGTSALRSDAGAITATDLTGNLTAETDAGTVTINGVTGTTEARSRAAAVSATRLGGSTEATSQAGPVTVNLLKPADVTARSDAADVTVSTPPGPYKIDARDIDQPQSAIPDDPGAPHTLSTSTAAGQARITTS